MSHRHRDKIKIIVISVILLLLVSIYAYRAYTYRLHQPIKIMKYPIKVDFSTNPKLGVTGTPDLNFGRVPNKLVATRFITMNNTYGIPVNISPEIDGNVSPFISLNSNSWSLQPGQAENLNVSVELPEGEPLGNYTGTLTLYVKRI